MSRIQSSPELFFHKVSETFLESLFESQVVSSITRSQRSLYLCVPSMHLIQKGFKSSVYRMNIEEQKKQLTMQRTTRSQLREGDRAWEGRLWESHQAMNKKSIRGRQGGMSWHNTAKSLHLTALEVNGTLGWWSIKCLPGEISPTCAPGKGGSVRRKVDDRGEPERSGDSQLISCPEGVDAGAPSNSAEAIVVGIKRVGGLRNCPIKQRDPWNLNPTKG